MRVTKKLKFVEGEGLEKLLKYTKKIKARQKAVEETERLFNEVKEQILNKEYEKAKEGFERIFYEEIPSDAIIKMAQLGENELNINMKAWCQNFIRTGKGFHMLIYQYI